MGVKDKQPHLGLVLIEGVFGLGQEVEGKWDEWQVLLQHRLEMELLCTRRNRLGT